jgi:hypothetical protein
LSILSPAKHTTEQTPREFLVPVQVVRREPTRLYAELREPRLLKHVSADDAGHFTRQ